MAFDLNFHQMKSITATVGTPLPGSEVLGKVQWVNLKINTKDGAEFRLVCFFSDRPELAQAYVDAINGVSESADAIEQVAAEKAFEAGQ